MQRFRDPFTYSRLDKTAAVLGRSSSRRRGASALRKGRTMAGETRKKLLHLMGLPCAYNFRGNESRGEQTEGPSESTRFAPKDPLESVFCLS